MEVIKMTDYNRREGCSQEITSNLMNMEPAGVMYQIYGARIAEALETYLVNKGIDVKVLVMLDDKDNVGYKQNPEHVKQVKVFALIDTDSEDVKTNALNVAPAFRAKFAQSANIQFSEKLSKLMFPFAKNGERDANKPFRFVSGKRNVGNVEKAYIVLDIFKVLRFLLNASNNYRVQILETTNMVYNKHGKDCVIQVMKYKNYGRSKSSSDEEKMAAAFRDIRG